MDAIPIDFRLTCRRGLDALLLAAPPMLSLLLLARRAAGAPLEPLPTTAWLLTGLIMAAWLQWSMAWLPGRFATPLIARLPMAWFPIAIAALLGLALWLPGTRLLALACYAAIVAVGGSQRIKLPWGPIWPTWLRPTGGWQAETAPVDTVDAADEESAAAALPPAVVQQLVRRRDPGEAESLRGSVRADFVAGQRMASAHVAICPPFIAQPRCQVAVAAGPSAEVRVASALPFGVRFEIKLAQAASQPASVVIEFAVDSTDGEAA
ncbi:MAG TPA: hypothetical protein VGG30_03110 [Pirellulales bacterium]|jgi:hypothetical protein